MKNSNVILRLLLGVGLALSSSVAGQVSAQRRTTARAPVGVQVSERNVRAHMEFLASDAMQGRGSGTQFELLAGHYIASQLRQYGVEPAGDAGAVAAGQKSFIQTIALTRQSFAGPPALSFNAAGGGEKRWLHGREMLATRITAARLSGALQKLRTGGRCSSRGLRRRG